MGWESGSIIKEQDVDIGKKKIVIMVVMKKLWWSLAQVAQGCCECLIPGIAEGQIGWGFEKPRLVECVPDHGKEGGTKYSLMSLPIQAILWFYDKQPIM